MFIANQDRDGTHSVRKIFYRRQYHGDLFLGWNIYGRKLFRNILLGTYDTEEDAKQIVGEIYTLKPKKYVMPEAALTLEEMGVAL